MEYFPIAFPFFFVAVWFFSLGMIANTSGWAALARKYRCDSSFLGPCKGWTWARIGYASYKGCMWIGASADGLYLKTGPLFFFRPFHPPLLIPWRDIVSVEEGKYWWVNVFNVRLSDPGIKLAIKRESLPVEAKRFLGDKLKLLSSHKS
jgi:hypothetical protein